MIQLPTGVKVLNYLKVSDLRLNISPGYYIIVNGMRWKVASRGLINIGSLVPRPLPCNTENMGVAWGRGYIIGDNFTHKTHAL